MVNAEEVPLSTFKVTIRKRKNGDKEEYCIPESDGGDAQTPAKKVKLDQKRVKKVKAHRKNTLASSSKVIFLFLEH